MSRWVTAPRLTLVDEHQRLVRVVAAPVQARRRPPQTLVHSWTDAYHATRTEVVGRFVAQPTPLDLDYRLARTSGGDALLAHLAIELEPTLALRRFSDGRVDLLTVWD
jgi:hypothetical protein